MGFVKWSNTALVTRLTLPSPGTETSTPSSRACLSVYSEITNGSFCMRVRARPLPVLVPPQSTVHLWHAVLLSGNKLPSEEANDRFQVSRIVPSCRLHSACR